jgi:hypothetical protein
VAARRKTSAQLYRHQLADKRWKDFRERVFAAQGELCFDCGAGWEATLQIHHVAYVPGRLPWEYDVSACRVVCSGCHAREHGHIIPKDGWDLVTDYDLGDLDGNCDLCDTQIRYVFTVHHPAWEPMDVGIICCDNLTGTTLGSERKTVMDRRVAFTRSRRWKGNVLKQEGIRVEIRPFPGEDAYQVCLDVFLGRVRHVSRDDARAAVFDLFEDGVAQAFIERQRRLRGSTW